MSEKENIPEELPQKPKKKSTPQDPYVIGIGASAGGLQALDALFDNIPRDSVAYVIVQHLSSEHKSLLREVLSKHSQLRFREAENNLRIEINNVYVIPAGKQITLKNNFLQVTDRVLENAISRTIDTFFKSLAKEKGDRAIGIILSGTGSDGTEGIRALKKAKALVIVQDPETAKFDGMPRSAINSGYVDFVLPPQAMPEEIFNFVKVTPLTEELSAQISDTDPAFIQILEMVRERSGVDFSHYKRPTIIRRISRRMAFCNTETLVEYLDYLHLHHQEVETLGKEFLIGVTNFFRDPEAFEIIEKDVIPTLVAGKNIADQLRIWVAGCSSGEEAYSLAILIREHLDAVNKELEVKIFASDIDRDALDLASKGLYSEESLQDISDKRRKNFFIKEENKYRVVQRVRRMVIFAPHNIINDAPFSKIDLVSCRNMLIYLSPMLQKKVIYKFHYALQVGSYLFLGPSESIGDGKSFIEVNKKWKIFQSVTQSRALGFENFGSTNFRLQNQETRFGEYARDLNTKGHLQHNLAEILNESILEEYSYAAIYVDENYDVIHGFGEYTRYLSLPNRNFTLNLFKLVPPDLALNLGTMLRKVSRDKERITAQNVLIRDKEESRRVNISIKPFLHENKAGQRLILILFNEDKVQEIPQTTPQVFWNEAHYENRVTELETELQNTKEDLQSVVEELETANEELQSTNEELLSSNEELQSTNEELQSLNEELHTVNAEHQYKIKILMELDDDLNNYFRSTDIGQVFVDTDLNIRKFTPAATQQINLIDSDIGRSITQLSNNLNYDSLIEDLEETILLRKTIEKEVQNKSGVWYQMRILPYLTQENKVDGAIIIFIQINELKTLHLLHTSILNSSPNAILALKAVRNNLNIIIDFECTLLNIGGEELLRVNKRKLLGKPLSQTYPALLHHGLLEQYINIVNGGDVLDQEQYQQVSAEGSRWLHITGVKLDDGLVLNLQDITERKLYEQQLLTQQEEITSNAERFRTLFEAVPHITWTNKPNGENNSFNQHWYEYTGFTREESEGWNWTNAFHPDDLKKFIPQYKSSLQTGKVHNAEARIMRRSDSQYRWHLVKDVPIRNEEGEIILWIGTATDVHDQKEAQEANTNLRLDQQKEILNTVLQTQEAERKRISEALHNGLGQILYAAKLNLDDLKPETEVKKNLKDRVNGLLNEAIAATRNISFELTPTVLRDFGLKTAIEELINRLTSNNLIITCDLVGVDKRFDDLIEISLYRIIQELLNNIIKHAQATEAHIELLNQKGFIYLRVQDNGSGFKEDETPNKKGIGLSSIRNRVKLLDGVLKVDSRMGKGTGIEIKVRNRSGVGVKTPTV
jgi:two-component system, chemotaxis family, CheB/CheR fusion protein